MNEVQKIVSVIWVYVPERSAVVMTFVDNADGNPLSIEDLDMKEMLEGWNEMEALVFKEAERWCRDENAILDQTTYFNNLEERFKTEPQQKEQQ